MIKTYYQNTIPHQIILISLVNGKKYVYKRFDTIFLSFDDTRFRAVIQNSGSSTDSPKEKPQRRWKSSQMQDVFKL